MASAVYPDSLLAMAVVGMLKGVYVCGICGVVLQG